MGAIAAGLAGAAIVGVVVLDQGSESRSPEQLPSAGSLQAPPWGFMGNWQDYCYRPVATPPGYAVHTLNPGESCSARATRFTTAQQLELVARAGATTARLPVSWAKVESRAPVRRGNATVHTYEWARVVGVYREMLAAGIRPVVLVFGAPAWARPPGWRRPGTCQARGKPCAYLPAVRHLPDWRRFVEELVRRVPELLALEVWNEPNLPRFFAPRPSPPLYARLLQLAHSAGQATGTHAPILAGGLAPTAGGVTDAIPPARFLADVYRLAGKASFGGIATHPYPHGPPWVASMTRNLDQLRRVRARFGDQRTPLWITEVGVGGKPGPRLPGSVDLARQGPILAHMYRSIQGKDVRAFLIYSLRDIPKEGPKYEPFGVVRANLQPKPAYCYLARELGGLSRCSGE